jgi:hypothetical protein
MDSLPRAFSEDSSKPPFHIPIHIRYSMLIYDKSLLGTAAFDVRSDKDKFNNASKQTLEDDFFAWRESEEFLNGLTEETIIANQEREELRDKGISLIDSDLQTHVRWSPYTLSPRYKHFIFIDQLALESVLGEEPNTSDWFVYSGWVNLVYASRPQTSTSNPEIRALNEMMEREEREEWGEDEVEEEKEEEYSARDADRNVVRINAQSLKDVFTKSVDANVWDREWAPPPLVRNGSTLGYDPIKRVEIRARPQY